jgi:hypothetical protein
LAAQAGLGAEVGHRPGERRRGSGSTEYFGGFARPLHGRPQAGDLILGAQAVDPEVGSSYELQGEYRAPFGLGAGGGIVEVSQSDLAGPRFLFVNATLHYSRGFLSHDARLGRAMGPQGLEYGNPLGFLAPFFNRRHDVWELGNLADYRLVRLELPNGSVQEKHELLVFPFNLDGCGSVLDWFFVGGSYDRNAIEDTPGVLAGMTGKIWFLEVNVGIEYATETDNVTATIGLIDWF